jgi:hypothetical protein
MQKLLDYLLRIIMVVLLLAYITFCAITCNSNPQAKEPQWMEWESK